MERLTDQERFNFREKLTVLLDAAKLLKDHYANCTAAGGLHIWEMGQNAAPGAKPDEKELTFHMTTLARQTHYDITLTEIIEEISDVLATISGGKDGEK